MSLQGNNFTVAGGQPLWQQQGLQGNPWGQPMATGAPIWAPQAQGEGGFFQGLQAGMFSPTPQSLQFAQFLGAMGAAMDPQGFAGALYGPAQQMTQNRASQFALAQQQAAPTQPQQAQQQQQQAATTQQPPGQTIQAQPQAQALEVLAQPQMAQVPIGPTGASIQSLLPALSALGISPFPQQQPVGSAPLNFAPVQQQQQQQAAGPPAQRPQAQAQPPPAQPRPPTTQAAGGGQVPLPDPAVLSQQAAAGYPSLTPLQGPLASMVSIETLDMISNMLQREFEGRQQAGIAAQTQALQLANEQRAQQLFPGKIEQQQAYIKQANAYALTQERAADPGVQQQLREQAIQDYALEQQIRASLTPGRVFGSPETGYSMVHPVTGALTQLQEGTGPTIPPPPFTAADASARRSLRTKWAEKADEARGSAKNVYELLLRGLGGDSTVPIEQIVPLLETTEEQQEFWQDYTRFFTSIQRGEAPGVQQLRDLDRPVGPPPPPTGGEITPKVDQSIGVEESSENLLRRIFVEENPNATEEQIRQFIRDNR